MINSVAIVGAGNVGQHLARALAIAGIEVRFVVSRTPKSARELAAETGAKVVNGISGMHPLPDIVILSVSDDILPVIASEYKNEGTVICHTSGSTGLEVFEDKYDNFGVFYPLQTFSKSRELDYSSIPFFIEAGNQEVEEKLISLADRISGKWERADSEARKVIHLAAVFACNFSNHLAVIAKELLEQNEMNMELLIPLLKETYLKIEEMDPLHAQTGPAVRGDQRIMNEHLELLSEKPKEQILYKLLSENIIRYRKRNE